LIISEWKPEISDYQSGSEDKFNNTPKITEIVSEFFANISNKTRNYMKTGLWSFLIHYLDIIHQTVSDLIMVQLIKRYQGLLENYS
jgi:hypothetical protein